MSKCRKKNKVEKVALTQQIKCNDKQQIISLGKHQSATLTEGHFISKNFGSGFSIHGGDSVELMDTTVVSTAQPTLSFMVLLQGNVRFGYDDLLFNLDANFQPVGVAVNLNKPVNFVRSIRKDNHIKKLTLAFSQQWIRTRLNDDCNMSQFIELHKGSSLFNVTALIQEITMKILSLVNTASFINALQIEALSHSLLFEIIKQNFAYDRCSDTKVMEYNETINEQKTENKESLSVESVVGYIESHLSQNLSLESIAFQFSMSISNLQRKFKQQLGLTVSSYIRHRRLEIAKYHLEAGLTSVTEAAYEAGYHHPANFTSAFKKVFGKPPTVFYKGA